MPCNFLLEKHLKCILTFFFYYGFTRWRYASSELNAVGSLFVNCIVYYLSASVSLLNVKLVGETDVLLKREVLPVFIVTFMECADNKILQSVQINLNRFRHILPPIKHSDSNPLSRGLHNIYNKSFITRCLYKFCFKSYYVCLLYFLTYNSSG